MATTTPNPAFIELARHDDGDHANQPSSPNELVRPISFRRPARDGPLLVSLPFVLSSMTCVGLVLAAAAAEEGAMVRVAVFDTFGLWSWTYALCLAPCFLHASFFVLALVIRGVVLLRRRLPGGRRKRDHYRPPWRHLIIALATYLAMGAVSTLSWGSRHLPRSAVERAVELSDVTFDGGGMGFAAATSAYQVEGGLTNTQWYRFEQTFVHPDGRPGVAPNETCGSAADTWRRFDEDLACMEELGLDAYRLSVEWSRVEPERGVFDMEALARYRLWTERLRAAGIVPVVTLHHFTEPLWITDAGGLENASTAVEFGRFVAVVAEALAPTVDRWITVNEIMVVAAVGWISGEFPPGHEGDIGGLLRAMTTLIEMHRVGYRVLKATDTVAYGGGAEKACEVSVAKNVALFRPASAWSPVDAFVAGFLDGFYNKYVLMQVLRARAPPEPGTGPGRLLPKGSGLDFIGINHYFNQVVSGFGGVISHEAGYELSDMGWALRPESLYEVVTTYHSWWPSLPIVITEHGVADARDPDERRVAFLERSLLALRLAVRDRGVPVIMYTHWALIDNWEWGSYRPRFGLYRVDFNRTFARTETSGARRYRAIIAANRAARTPGARRGQPVPTTA